MFKKKNNLLQTAIAIACMSVSLTAHAAVPAKPNVVTIMIDDMGFSDLGAFGGEISTPNLDALVSQGTQLTNYYSAPTSTPARAMFFTGRDNHAAGVGNMDGYSPDRPPQTATQATSDEYKGRLTKSLPTFPELLKNSGYYTMMAGKWDLGDTPGEYPVNRGFNDSLVLLPGGDIHFLSDATGKLITSQPASYYANLVNPATGNIGGVTTPYNKNGLPFSAFPPNAFSTDFYTDQAIAMLDNRDTTKPFYLNVAHIASHAPFQAPPDLIAKYLPVYSQGWDKMRTQRFAKLKSLGLIPANAVLPPRDVEVMDWTKLSADQQKVEAARMAAYAGLVEKLDTSVGKLIQHLKDIGQYNNTVFFVMSDNGAAAIESGSPAKTAWVAAHFTKDTIASVANIGSSTSFIPATEGLGMLSNTPLNRFKAETFDGGIHTAAIMFAPSAAPAAQGAKYNCLASVMDIPATILKMTGVTYPKSYTYTPLGSTTAVTTSLSPMDGKPMDNVFAGDLSCKYPTRALGFEQDSAKMLRQGDWKLAQQFDAAHNRWDGHFYLFNLKNDPFELHDLSQAYPDEYKNLLGLYNIYAVKNQVINVGPRLFSPIANLKIADSANNLVSGGMILGGSQLNHISIQHVPTLPQVASTTPPRPALAAPQLVNELLGNAPDVIDVAAEIYPPLAQQKLGADVMVASYYKPASGAGVWKTVRRAYNRSGKIVSSFVPSTQTVDGSTTAPDFSTVPTFSAHLKAFTSRVELPIYEGKVTPGFQVGTYYFWVGYKLSDGTINHSASPIVLNVMP